MTSRIVEGPFAALQRMSYDAGRLKARLLVTGFEPFGGQAVNPSERMVRLIAAAAPAGAVVSTRVLPVAYRRAFPPVAEALETERLRGALLLGLGAGRATLDFERFGVNWRGGTQPDNDGLRIAGEEIDPAGPAAYFTTLPVDAMVAACRAAGAPTGVSSHAGTYLCNQVLYQTLRHCDRHDLKCRVGFVHLPYLPEQATGSEASVSEESMIAGLRAAIERLADSD
jgi:pyroglutamyl-peptidase